MKADTCTEFIDYYGFSLIPEDLAPNDCFFNSTVYLVRKSDGAYKSTHFSAVWKEPTVREIDPSTLN